MVPTCVKLSFGHFHLHLLQKKMQIIGGVMHFAYISLTIIHKLNKYQKCEIRPQYLNKYYH